MNKDIKQLWLENLRNGKYSEMRMEDFPETITSDLPLRWKNKYNALGVLCDLYAKSANLEKPWSARFYKQMPEWKSIEFLGTEWSVAQQVYKWADLKRSKVENQIWNMTFGEAAKYIEDNL
jgi:hypothetical protein